MIEILAYLGCLVAIMVVCYKVRLASTDRRTRGLRHIAGFAVCIAGALGLDAVMTLAITAPLPAVAGLVSDELKMAALGFLIQFADSVRRKAVRGRRYAVATASAMLLAAVLFFLSGAHQYSTDVVTFTSAGVGVFVAYNVVLICYEVWGLLTFATLIRRFARLVEPGLLRTGLHLIIVGALIGVPWTGWQLDDIWIAVVQHQNTTSEDEVSAVLAALCVLVSAAGATLSAWGPYLSGPARWLGAQWRYAQLRPLWTAMHAAMPAIALSTVARQQGGVEFALYRHVIEIRDAQLALRGHIHPDVQEWASDAVRRVGTHPARREATIEAATIAAAVIAHEAGVDYRAGEVDPHRVDPSLGAETRWLAQVSRAFAHSRAVAQVRARMAAELSGVPSTSS
ncbi:MAB_1171c family putative transporter [Kutzneria sp. 744]|uniref:MAB_1171c family putative transporter n=1 Tax=Kutzneria sp. (strain 744) TaxID=345341 RepID=UPI0003EEAB51|nr:MAB_1171c family putative transporter [Kutzneria sp. 744]EWM18023.1 DEAD/DEAH box helicase [Kutzneria sp. 744]